MGVGKKSVPSEVVLKPKMVFWISVMFLLSVSPAAKSDGKENGKTPKNTQADEGDLKVASKTPAMTFPNQGGLLRRGCSKERNDLSCKQSD